ncbi:MAG: hypothetical protein JRL30_05465 [Deltaproteobacteria bacterium]|nr:hypothetical protein [Deltaproteobacteria bacterium]
MQFYWRIIEELKFLGETVIFHDPSLLRQYHWWIEKNALGLAFSQTDYTSRVDPALRDLKSLTSLN